MGEDRPTYYEEAPDLGPMPPDPFTKHHMAFVVIPPDRNILIWAFCAGYLFGAIVWGIGKAKEHNVT
jgi:hypothetical protein